MIFINRYFQNLYYSPSNCELIFHFKKKVPNCWAFVNSNSCVTFFYELGINAWT